MSKHSRPSGFPKQTWILLDDANGLSPSDPGRRAEVQAQVRWVWNASAHRNPPTAAAIVAEALGVTVAAVQAKLDASREAEKAQRLQREAARILVSCDGLCEPRNPGGTATFGWVARRGGELLASDCGVVARGHRATNNLAEYTAIIEALGWLDGAGHAAETIVLRSDSQLAIYQLDGTYAVRSPAIWPLWSEASKLARRFSDLRFEWVRREQNKEADALTRKAYEESFTAEDLAAQQAARMQRVGAVLSGVVRTSTGWRVPSSTGRGWYSVRLEPDRRCSCPDFSRRHVDCKHLLAVREIEARPTPGPAPAPPS